jgi:hypothetical protein
MRLLWRGCPIATNQKNAPTNLIFIPGAKYRGVAGAGGKSGGTCPPQNPQCDMLMRKDTNFFFERKLANLIND